MPNRDANGNLVYSQAEYEHLNFMGEPFCGFVEGIGYMGMEVVVTPHAMNKSKRTIINEINYIQYTLLLNDSLSLVSFNNAERESIDESSKDYRQPLTAEELRLALEKSQSYSFNQGNLPKVYRFISWITSEYDNFAVNAAYNTVNDLFQVVQAVSLGAFEREEWYNPFTGTRYGNLDGTPNYEPVTGFITGALMAIPIASKSVGYVIPKGMFHLNEVTWGKGTAGKYFNQVTNFFLGFINGQLSGGRGVIKAKSLAPKIKEYREKHREIKKDNNE